MQNMSRAISSPSMGAGVEPGRWVVTVAAVAEDEPLGAAVDDPGPEVVVAQLPSCARAMELSMQCALEKKHLKHGQLCL